MKRTNLVLPEDLLKEAVQISGEKTYSAAVVAALREFVRRAKARQILALPGMKAVMELITHHIQGPDPRSPLQSADDGFVQAALQGLG